MLARMIVHITVCCLVQRGTYLVKDMRIERDVAISTNS